MSKNNKVKEVPNEQNLKYDQIKPNYSYLDCIIRSYGTGLGALTLTFFVFHIGQKIVSKRFPIVHKTHIAVSILAAATVSYWTAKEKLQTCSNLT